MQWPIDSPPPLVSPAGSTGEDLFAAFPGHQRQQLYGGSPWPTTAAAQSPPRWAQALPPPQQQPPPPAWATNAQAYQQYSPTRSWHTALPSDPGNADDAWGIGSTSFGLNTPYSTRPTDSAFGQPITSGFFGANSSPNRNQDPWNRIVRSTSERTQTPKPYSGGGSWWSPPPGSESNSIWEITRPKSAGPGKTQSPWRSNRIGLPSHLIPDTWDETNLARRPRDWRAGYNPRASFLSSISALPSALRNQSDVQEITDYTKRRLAPFLEWHPTNPPVVHDLRLNPLHHSTPMLHAQMSTNDYRKPFTELDMAQFATTPTAELLRLFHPKLPWYIDIKPSHPSGIIVYDVVSQLYDQLQQQIMARHYWNDVLNEEARKEIGKAFDRRVKLLGSGREQGIFWIDFLGGEIVFEGLAKGKGGMWEIKTRNAYQ